MMNDPTTKVIGLFLDALHEFVDCCKLDLGFWLYTLMTKLLSKQGAELVPTVQNKIDKLYELVRYGNSKTTLRVLISRYTAERRAAIFAVCTLIDNAAEF